MGKRQKWSSDGARSRRGAERDREIGQRGRHRETSHNEVGEGRQNRREEGWTEKTEVKRPGKLGLREAETEVEQRGVRNKPWEPRCRR